MKRIVLPCLLGASLIAGAFLLTPFPATTPVSAQTRGPALADPVLQLSDRFEAIASRVLPAVVSVEAVKPAKTNKKPVEESGSGVVIKSDVKPGYYVLTNNHVIA